MRIVMLGHSNVGKTTYIAMMYEFMNKVGGHNGFRIQASDQAQHAELLANAAAVSNGRYPPPTSRRDTYEFELSYQGTSISQFIWSDYRGGALTERSTDEDMAALLADLKNCDGLVLFVDAHELATAPDAQRRVRRLTVLAQQAINAQRTPIPVVLTYTKADLIKKSAQWSQVIEPLAQLSTALQTSRNIKGTVVTVSCGRRRKAVHVPVLWCLTYAVGNMIKDVQDDVAYYHRQAEAAGKQGSVVNSLKSWWDGTESEWRKQSRYQREAQQRLDELRPLLAPSEKLGQTLLKAQRKDGPPRAFRKATNR